MVLKIDPELSESVNGRRNGNIEKKCGKKLHKKWHVIDHQCFHQLFYPVIHVIFPTISVGPQTLILPPVPPAAYTKYDKKNCAPGFYWFWWIPKHHKNTSHNLSWPVGNITDERVHRLAMAPFWCTWWWWWVVHFSIYSTFLLDSSYVAPSTPFPTKTSGRILAVLSLLAYIESTVR